MEVTEKLTTLETAYNGVYQVTLLLLAVLLFACLLRAVKGPRIADRIVAINMMGTMVMVILAVMSFMLEESYLLDICLIYAMVSFLAVIVLTKVYLGVYEEKRREMHSRKQEQEGGEQ